MAQSKGAPATVENRDMCGVSGHPVTPKLKVIKGMLSVRYWSAFGTAERRTTIKTILKFYKFLYLEYKYEKA